MAGVLLSQGPAELRLVHLSHELPAQDVRSAALFLRQAVPRFPEGTVHLAVIDPGVGGARRAVAVALGGQALVGPDNGIFGWLLDGSERAVELAPERLASGPISSTFHGRDLFAPAAARLAAGVQLETLGTAADSLIRLPWPRPLRDGRGSLGEIVHVDHFGNLITNLTPADLPATTDAARVYLGERPIGTLVAHYAAVARGQLAALIGSDDLLEIAERDGDAACRTGARVGDAVRVEAPGSPEG